MEKITYSTYWGYQQPEAVEAFQNQFKKDTGVTLEVISVAKDRWQDKVAAMFVSGMPRTARCWRPPPTSPCRSRDTWHPSTPTSTSTPASSS